MTILLLDCAFEAKKESLSQNDKMVELTEESMYIEYLELLKEISQLIHATFCNQSQIIPPNIQSHFINIFECKPWLISLGFEQILVKLLLQSDK